MRSLDTRLLSLGLDAAEVNGILAGNASALSTSRDLALLAFDADAIQSHLLASPRPVTIQGASLLLRAWDQELASRNDPRMAVLFAGGGTATLLVRANQAAEVGDGLRAEFHRKTHGATATTAWTAVSARELVTGPEASQTKVTSDLQARLGWSPEGGAGFGGCMARLHAELRKHKLEPKAHLALPDGASHLARCRECGMRPRAAGELCFTCDRNRAEGAREKRAWATAASFEDVLGKEGDRIAFVRIDGKGIGLVIEQLRTLKQYHEVSSALTQAFHWDAQRLASLARIPSERLQIPIAGGDDLLFVVPVKWNDGENDVWGLTVALMAEIERSFDSPQVQTAFEQNSALLQAVRSIGVGVGIVVSRTLPATFCFDYAMALVRSAKAVISGKEGARSAVDFAVLSDGSPLSQSMASLRERDCLDIGVGPFRPKLALTAKPYKRAEFEQFVDLVRRLPGSRTSLYALRQAMLEPDEGVITIAYQLARDPKLREALVGGHLQPIGEKTFAPWILRQSPAGAQAEWATAIPDLLEVVRWVWSGKEQKR